MATEVVVHRIGVMPATAVNIIGMIGVGPFITLPIMITQMGGPHVIYAWVAGGILAFCDGLVYAQFAAALPGTGGPYVYLHEAYRDFRIGKHSLGRLMAFVFIFQIILVAPLTIASGAIGFADYAGYLGVPLSQMVKHLVASGVCVAMVVLLYRNIESVGRLSVFMLGGVLLTMAWIILAGLFHFSLAQAFDFPPAAFTPNADLWMKLGAVSLLAMYNYGGYNNVCYIGDEVDNAPRTLPRAIMLSIVVVVLLYVMVSTVVLGTVHWQDAAQTKTIASVFIEATFKNPVTAHQAGQLMTVLILFVTASSLYAVILGMSRIPFAAARAEQFFSFFGHQHPRMGFPDHALLVVGLSAIPFCFIPLGKVVDWLILVQIVTQFVWQCAGLLLLTRHRKDIAQPYVMWLYPLPVLLTAVLWIGIFLSADREGQTFSLGFLALAVAAFFMFEGHRARQAA